MGREKISAFVFAVFVLISLSSALTAKLGNSKMVLRADVGETVENFLRVINDNDVSVTIELTASGDSENDFKLKDSEFSLAPGEEKRAYFTIKARDEGTFATKINVLFKPEEGNSVGLLANVILVVGNSDSDADLNEDDSDTTITGDVVQNEGKNSSFSFGQKNSETSESFSLSPFGFAVGSTIVLFLTLIVLYFISVKKSGKVVGRNLE